MHYTIIITFICRILIMSLFTIRMYFKGIQFIGNMYNYRFNFKVELQKVCNYVVKTNTKY